MGYSVDILHDVVTANDRSTIVDPMAESVKLVCLVRALRCLLMLLLACYKLLVKLCVCCFSECWEAGCWVQLVAGVVGESLSRHIWSICLLGCRLCGFWWVSRSHVRSVVVWTNVWVRCVLLFLKIQFLLPYFYHLMNLYGSWCWSCWYWEARSRDFWCGVLLLRRCWWHIARPLHSRVLSLLASCCHSWLLFQAMWWEILLWIFLL